MSSVTLSGLSLERVEPSDEAAIRDWYQLLCAVASADRPDEPQPCWRHELGRALHPWPGHDQTLWVVQTPRLSVEHC